uniref:Uncharacterized protein n=1 Tax=Arundo donax TaxID=35708 RepID=A0A0A9DG96_ARUDO
MSSIRITIWKLVSINMGEKIIKSRKIKSHRAGLSCKSIATS